MARSALKWHIFVQLRFRCAELGEDGGHRILLFGFAIPGPWGGARGGVGGSLFMKNVCGGADFVADVFGVA